MHGALRAIREARLPRKTIAMYEPDGHSPAHGFAVMARIMASKPKPTAVFASTDSLAIGILYWCREHRVAIRDELAVVGYDNTEFSQFGFKPLTTVNYAADEISRIGVARILQRIESRDAVSSTQTRLVEPELIIRETA